jgi:hypothetical protein
LNNLIVKAYVAGYGISGNAIKGYEPIPRNVKHLACCTGHIDTSLERLVKSCFEAFFTSLNG